MHASVIMYRVKHDSKHDQLDRTAANGAPTSQAQSVSAVIPIATGVHATTHLGNMVLLGIAAAGLICCTATSSAASADDPKLCTFLLFCCWSASTLLSRADSKLKLPRPAIIVTSDQVLLHPSPRSLAHRQPKTTKATVAQVQGHMQGSCSSNDHQHFTGGFASAQHCLQAEPCTAWVAECIAVNCIPEAGGTCLLGWRLNEATSMRPLLSIADGMTILLPSLCMLLPAGLLAKALLLRAPRIPLPCPYALLALGFSIATTSMGRGMLACSCPYRQLEGTVLLH